MTADGWHADEGGCVAPIDGAGSIKASSGKVTGDNWPVASGGGGSAAGTPVSAAAAAAAAAALQQQLVDACDPATPAVLEDGSDGDAPEAQVVRLDDGRHPDTIADDIMAQPQRACLESQLQFLYKTCRCAALRGIQLPESSLLYFCKSECSPAALLWRVESDCEP